MKQTLMALGLGLVMLSGIGSAFAQDAMCSDGCGCKCAVCTCTDCKCDSCACHVE
jgi:hypothetical protein